MCRMRGNECCGGSSGNQSFPFAVDHGGCLYVCCPNVAMVASLACTSPTPWITVSSKAKATLSLEPQLRACSCPRACCAATCAVCVWHQRVCGPWLQPAVQHVASGAPQYRPQACREVHAGYTATQPQPPHATPRTASSSFTMRWRCSHACFAASFSAAATTSGSWRKFRSVRRRASAGGTAARWPDARRARGSMAPALSLSPPRALAALAPAPASAPAPAPAPARSSGEEPEPVDGPLLLPEARFFALRVRLRDVARCLAGTARRCSSRATMSGRLAIRAACTESVRGSCRC